MIADFTLENVSGGVALIPNTRIMIKSKALKASVYLLTSDL